MSTGTDMFLFTSVDTEGEMPDVAALCNGVEDVANRVRAQYRKQRKSGKEQGDIRVYALEVSTGVTRIVGLDMVGDPIVVKDGALDTRWRLTDNGGSVLHEFNVRVSDEDPDAVATFGGPDADGDEEPDED